MVSIPKSPVLGRLASEDVRSRTPRLPFGEATEHRGEQSYNPTRKSNLLVAGPSGSGKTNAADVLAAAARLQGATVYGIRAFGVDDRRFSSFANGLESAEKLVADLYSEVRARVQTINEYKVGTIEHVPMAARPGRIVVVIDGLSRLPLQEQVPVSLAEAARAEYYGYLVRSIDRLGRVGQHVRVHIIAVTDNLEFTLPWNTAAIRLDAAGTGHYDEGSPDTEVVKMWAAPSGPQLTQAMDKSAGARASNRSPHVPKA